MIGTHTNMEMMIARDVGGDSRGQRMNWSNRGRRQSMREGGAGAGAQVHSEGMAKSNPGGAD